MPKNILQDVVPKGTRKSIRDIKLQRQNQNAPLESKTNQEDERREREQSFHYKHKEEESVDWDEGAGESHSRSLLWLIGVVSAGVLIIVLCNIFSGATLTLTPKSQNVQINLDLTAKQNPKEGDLSYTPYVITREKSISIPADGEISVEKRATGKIIIYNDYSTTPQRLVKNTRFETPDGLIFKINDSITIPGRHSVNDKTIPGSIEASVFAESTGAEYNIGLTDFTIPGFKSNAERFAKFYARSKTAMTGGKVGKEKTVTEEKLSLARTSLDSTLLTELKAETKKNIPQGSILYDSAYQITFEPLEPTPENGKNNVTITERARFTAFFFKHGELARAVAENVIDNFDNAPVLINDDEKLVLTLNTKDAVNPTSMGPIQFNLKGNTSVIWQIDTTKLITELLGKNKKELATIASHDSSILKVSAVLRPFWNTTFPKKTSKIKVKIESDSI